MLVQERSDTKDCGHPRGFQLNTTHPKSMKLSKNPLQNGFFDLDYNVSQYSAIAEYCDTSHEVCIFCQNAIYQIVGKNFEN